MIWLCENALGYLIRAVWFRRLLAEGSDEAADEVIE
jgi:hypothetical protein